MTVYVQKQHYFGLRWLYFIQAAEITLKTNFVSWLMPAS